MLWIFPGEDLFHRENPPPIFSLLAALEMFEFRETLMQHANGDLGGIGRLIGGLGYFGRTASRLGKPLSGLVGFREGFC